MDTGYPDITADLAVGNWNDEIEKGLAAAIVDFNKGWRPKIRAVLRLQ